MALNWQGALAAGGTGGTLGSAFGPWGTGIGAGLGFLGGLFLPQGGESGGIGGKENYSPEELDYFKQLLQHSMQQYQNPYEGFEPIRQNALRTFQNDIVPYLQNQFSAQTGGHFSSGVLGRSLGGAGASLADRLASAQAQYGQQNQQNALQGVRLGLTPKSTLYNKEAVPGWEQSLAPYAAKGALGVANAYNEHGFGADKNQLLKSILASVGGR